MRKYKISGVPITQHGKLVGILTNRDLRFETRFDVPISRVMTKDHLITVPWNHSGRGGKNSARAPCRKAPGRG